jgi:hypothetical protein
MSCTCYSVSNIHNLKFVMSLVGLYEWQIRNCSVGSMEMVAPSGALKCQRKFCGVSLANTQ